MTKQILLIFCLCITVMLQATVSKTVNVTAGGLSTALTFSELTTVTDLTVTGTIDARDFVTMRDKAYDLTIINLSGANILAYNGTLGTSFETSSTSYLANTIPEEAFDGNTSLASITLPLSVTSIGDWAFVNCTGLTTITFPSLVKSIGNYTFDGCKGLKGTLTIPSSVSYIGTEAFNSCTGLTSINYNATNCIIGNSGGAFLGCSALKTLTIGANVTIIPNYIFEDCSGFTGTLNIPSSVLSIGDYAFGGCTGLTGTITIPMSVTSINAGAFQGCIGLTGILTIPSSVTSIGIGAFSYCTGLTGTLTIPSSVTSINAGAFEGCTGLTSITIPSSVTSIEDYVFEGCIGLTSITIPSSIKSIGSEAFKSCTGLTGTLIIPSSVTSIASLAFSDCTGITRIVSESKTPAQCVSTTFDGMNTNTCVLNVPVGTALLYKNCTGWRDFFANIVETTTAISNITNASINLYPNPITESFQISGLEGMGTITLSDLNGKIILLKQVFGNENISVGTLSKGIYILKIITNEGTIERKVVKK